MTGIAYERLRGLGIKEKKIDEYIELLGSAHNMESLKRECGRREYGAGAMQVIAPLFREMYLQNSYVRDEAIEQLGNLGVPHGEVVKYFTEMGNFPSTIFHAENQNIQLKTRLRFIEKAEEFMLKTLKEYVGVG